MKNILKLIGVTIAIFITTLIVLTPIELLTRYLESKYSDITMIIIYASSMLLLIGYFAYRIVFKDKK